MWGGFVSDVATQYRRHRIRVCGNCGQVANGGLHQPGLVQSNLDWARNGLMGLARSNSKRNTY